MHKTFKSEECIICLTKPPNVLFCNCGHLCVCEECSGVNEINTLSDLRNEPIKCPLCKTENRILRIIE